MSEKQIYRLVHSEARRRAAQAALEAPEGYIVRITPPTRSLDANAKFHAICSDLARQQPYGGKLRSLEVWKSVIVSAHSIATNEPTEIVCGIEGEFLNLRESTASMSVARMSSLIEYALAYCAMNGVRTTG